MNSYADLSDLALKNVLALANIENPGSGEDGTSAGYCYFEQTFGGTYAFKVFCNSNTNASTIYPCESNSFGSYLEMSKDRCTM